MQQIIEIKDGMKCIVRKLHNNDLSGLQHYLQCLSAETKSKFGPHQFDVQSIASFYEDKTNTGYIATSEASGEIVAYSIIKTGFLGHDSYRLQSYGLTLDENTDCTFAPSVADKYQGIGLGSKMFPFILSDLKEKKLKRIILWGGVQVANKNAMAFYKKYGFLALGNFEYHGLNTDMMLKIQ